jgi:RHS repeat-associated protein
VYDDFGDLVQVTDAAGGEWDYDYDARHNLLVATDPAGNEANYTYDALGRLTTYEDRTGVSWTYAYDPVGRPAVVSDDALNSTVITYDKSGNALSVTDPVGVKITRVYDKLNRPTSQTTTGLTYATSFAYNAAGDLLTQTTSSQTATSTYDVRGRRLTSTDPLGRVTTYTYDNANNLVTETDPAGHANAFSYDSLGRLTGVTDPLGNATTYSYDSSGNLVGLELPDGGDYTFAYDSLHQLVSETDPLAAETAFDYDALGNLSSTTKPSGNIISSTWSATGYELTRSAGGETRSYSYDAEGRMLTASTPDFSVEFGYDARGLLTPSTDEIGETTFAFDSAQRMSQIALPNGDVTNITYNGFGSVATIRGPTNFNYGYDRWANLTSRTAVAPTSTSTSQTFTYFGDNAAKSAAVGSSNLAQTFTSDGQVATSTNAINGVVNPAEGTTTYAYDSAGRLTSWALSSGGTPVGGEQYTWDANGNRTSVTVGATTTTASFDAADQLVSTSDGTTFEHSDDGELLAVDSAAGPDASYEYNAFGELVGAVVDGQAVQLERDALGRVVEQTVAGQTTAYGYHGPSNAPNAVRSPAGALTGILRDSTGAAIGTHTGATTSSILSNLHGDTALYFGSSSTPTATALYSPFGTPTTTGSAPTALGYQGMVQSPSLDLVDMGARFYDPTTGRFTSRDSVVGHLANAASLNRYVYGLGAPLDHYDPDGHFAKEIGDFFGSLIGAGQKVLASVTNAVNHEYDRFFNNLVEEVRGFGPDNWATYQAVDQTWGGDAVGLLFGLDIVTNFSASHDLSGAATQISRVATTVRHALSQASDRLQVVHGALDVLGLVPVAGEAFDAINGALYLLEGDVVNASISFASMLPVAGIAIVGIGRIGLRVADNVVGQRDLLLAASRLPTVRPSMPSVAPAVRASDAGSFHVASPRVGYARSSLDVSVNPDAPRAKPWEGRPVGGSDMQNAFAQARVAELKLLGAHDIRINQQQVGYNGIRVGVNRPDVQYSLGGLRFYEEFDTVASPRGPGHGDRIAANDPLGVIILWETN